MRIFLTAASLAIIFLTRASAQVDGAEFGVPIPVSVTVPVVKDFLVPGLGENSTNLDRFELTFDAPWLSVFPQQGALSAGGTTVQFTIDPRLLPVATTTTTVVIERTQGQVRAAPMYIPFSVHRVPNVSARGRIPSPPQGTLIIPFVVYVEDCCSRFQSEVRITNTASLPATYTMSFTPKETNGTEVGNQITIAVAGNESKALNDIVNAWTDSFGIGTLEIRPGADADPERTFVTSRLSAVTTDGRSVTAFVPAERVDDFIGPVADDPLSKISLQHVSNNGRFTTQLEFVEGSGQTALIRVTLLDASGEGLAQKNLQLGPYEQRDESIDDSALFPDVTISDGRVEVEVISGTGRVTANAILVDRETEDLMFVRPVQAGRISANRWVLPGVAEFDGERDFQTDVRIFNAGAAPVTVTASYRPQTGDATGIPNPATFDVPAGDIKVIDDILPTLWDLRGTGGAVTFTTPVNSSLVISARSVSTNSVGGTFGQFIPAVMPAQAFGATDRAAELTQIEESRYYRSNSGIFEVTGSPATVIVTASSGGQTTTRNVELAGGEFLQIRRLFGQLGFGAVYDGWVTVKVVGGSGRISTYASVLDSRTEDSMFVPAL